MSESFWDAGIYVTDSRHTKFRNNLVPFCADKTPELITDSTWRDLRRVNIDWGCQVFPIMN